MIELSNNSHLQLTSEVVLYDGLSMEEKLEAQVEVVMEEDVQASLGLDIDEGQR